MFISPDYVKIAASRPTMYKATADGKGVTEIPIPANVRETGTIPDGYSVEFDLDPMVIINSLKNNGITTLEQLTAEGFEHGKKVINDPKNLAIIPTPLQLQKRALEIQTTQEKSNSYDWLREFMLCVFGKW